LSTDPIRVLLVDDHEQWRLLTSNSLQNRPDLQVVAQASDGLEAIAKAVQLRPDLVLLDIGLPKLNGIEVSRRIRETCPACKILFVSQESSPDIVREALATGASGYVLKMEFGTELLPAIETVLRGEQFVCRRLKNQLPEFFTITPAHEVVFYRDDRSLINHVTEFFSAALRCGCTAVGIVTESHRQQLLENLRREGLDMNAVVAQRRYATFDANDCISMFMQDGMPDQAQVWELRENCLAAVSNPAHRGQAGRVAIFGECAELLRAQGNFEASLAVEKLCNQAISRRPDVEVLCGYSMEGIQGHSNKGFLQAICSEHTAVHHR